MLSLLTMLQRAVAAKLNKQRLRIDQIITCETQVCEKIGIEINI